MNLITEVALPEYSLRINHHESSLLMGSCFTENIGRLMERYKFPVNINPFGVTYNPASVARQLDALMQKEAYLAEDLNEFNGLWFSFDHYTGFSSSDRQECLEQINQSFLQARKSLRQAKTLVLTWGTSWVYRYKQNGMVVCNCHKIPEKNFTRTRLSVKEMIRLYSDLLNRLFLYNQDLKILLTISPVRHWKDGAHGNQLSKAALLLASEALEQQFPGQVAYFPSYEIVMDELRDYRYFADDMLHVNSIGSQYIWQKFRKALIADESQEIIDALEPLLKMEAHRPMVKDEEAQRKARNKYSEKKRTLMEKYPFIRWE